MLCQRQLFFVVLGLVWLCNINRKALAAIFQASTSSSSDGGINLCVQHESFPSLSWQEWFVLPCDEWQ